MLHHLVGNHASNSQQLTSRRSPDTMSPLAASKFDIYMFLEKIYECIYVTNHVVRLFIWRLVSPELLHLFWKWNIVNFEHLI